MAELDPQPARKPGPLALLRTLWSVPTYRFAASFLLYLAAVAMVFPSLRLRYAALFHMAEGGTAQLVYALLSLFSDATRLSADTVVSLGSFSVTIIEECTGIYEGLILGAALLAYPTVWRNTALGFALGMPLIYGMNLVRIAVLLVAGRHSAGWFEFMHVYFWQVTMIAMVASAWLAWLSWVVRDEADPAAAA